MLARIKLSSCLFFLEGMFGFLEQNFAGTKKSVGKKQELVVKRSHYKRMSSQERKDTGIKTQESSGKEEKSDKTISAASESEESEDEDDFDDLESFLGITEAAALVSTELSKVCL